MGIEGESAMADFEVIEIVNDSNPYPTLLGIDWAIVMKPAQEKDRKDRSTPYNSVFSRGKPPLHYINEQYLDDSNDKTSFLYIGV